MDKEVILKKIMALFHDPPEKPLILGLVAHETRGIDLMNRITDDSLTEIPDTVKVSDYIASAADRINFPLDEDFYASFRREGFIKHPLSGKEFKVGSLEGYKDHSINIVNSIIDSIKSEYPDSLEKRYLAVWRLLREKLINADDKIGQLWDILPADTRVPDHSIWEHSRLTSAVVNALPKPAFVLFSIGPIQDFIAIARKTQDLWASSYMLSYISWRAMRVFAQKYGPDCIIFPDLLAQPFVDKWLGHEKGLQLGGPGIEDLSSPTLPNRFLAIVPSDKAKELAEEAKSEVNKVFEEICLSVKERMAKDLKINSEVWDNIWERQIKGFIEVYWTAIPTDYKKYEECYEGIKKMMGLDNGCEFDLLLNQYKSRGFEPNLGTIYGYIYRFLEKVSGSRKTLRDFYQSAEPNYKCTLCGVREPVHSGLYNGQMCSENFGALRSFWQDFIRDKYKDIRSSERLCAICLTKRFSSQFYFKEKAGFNINDSFPSVNMVATASFKLSLINNMKDNSLAVKVKNYIEVIKAITKGDCFGMPLPMVIRAARDEISKEIARLEGEWFYTETLENEKVIFEEYGKNYSVEDLNSLLKEAKKRLDELFAEIDRVNSKLVDKSQKIHLPSKYYAVLLMDGDNMGRWLSGEYAPQIGDVLHRTIRGRLSNDNLWKDLLRQKRPLNPSLHLTMSRALRDFSLKVVREIIEKDHLGKIVYSGGDDVLAFVNLRDLPDIMQKLRVYYSGNIKVNEDTRRIEIEYGDDGSGFVPVDENGNPLNIGANKDKIKGYIVSMGTNATASMGVVIAHHSSNLTGVLEDVRRAEKMAKGMKGKNAFCILVSKRSGGDEYTRLHWYYEINKQILDSISVLKKWRESFYYELLSPKLIYDLKNEVMGLEGLDLVAVESEMRRIFERHKNKKNIGDWLNSNNIREQMSENDYTSFMVRDVIKLMKNEHTLVDMVSLLSIAAFLAREENI